MSIRPYLAMTTLLLAAAPAWADDPLAATAIHGTLVLGGALIPEYEGSADFQAIPIVNGQIQYGHRYVAIDGLTARINVLDSEHWELGPLADLTFGRDDGVGNGRVAALDAIDDAIGVGAFVARTWQDLRIDGDEVRIALAASQDVSGVSDGWRATLRGGYDTPLGERWRVGVDLHLTAVSDDYADTYFSVTPAGAARSGLARYEASGGLNDVGIGISASYAFSERWSLQGFAGYRRLLGDAADSPIVDQAGDPNQFALGLGVGYSF